MFLSFMECVWQQMWDIQNNILKYFIALKGHIGIRSFCIHTYKQHISHCYSTENIYIYKVLLKVQFFLVVHFGSIAWECVIRVYTAIFGLQNIFVAWKGKENNNMLQFLAQSSCQRPYRRPTWYKNMLNIDIYRHIYMIISVYP